MSVQDRLIGFALASADLLVEIDPQGTIRLALGAPPLPGKQTTSLHGANLGDLIDGTGRTDFDELLTGLTTGLRSAPLNLTLCGGGEHRRPVTMTALRLPDLAPNISCALQFGTLRTAAPLMAPDAFVDRARSALGTDSANLAVAFVDVGGLEAAGQTAPQAVARVESAIRAAAAEGGGSTRLAPERFAVIRDADDTRDLSAEIDRIGRDEGLNLVVSVAQKSLEASGGSLNVLRALRLAVEGCLKDGGLENPGMAFSTALDRTLKDADRFQAMVRDKAFELHYQPIVDLETRAVRHFEALARFGRSGEPGAVIHMAEEMGLVEGFDLAVAQKALGRLRQPGAGLMKFAINVSGASLASDAYVQALLRMTDNDPSERKRLVVEVTETAALADIEAANRRLGALRQAGIRVCIDDFGSGSATFDYLRGLSVDTVKIDGRFVRGIERDDRSRTLITHLVELCAAMKLTTIAEMIETEEAAEIVKRLGVNQGQGWLFGRAEPDPVTTLPVAKPAARRVGAVEGWG